MEMSCGLVVSTRPAFRLSGEKSTENVRYHAFSGAVAHLNRVIGDLEKDMAKRNPT